MSDTVNEAEVVVVESKENNADFRDYKKKRPTKRKVCIFCADKEKVIDYKDPRMARFVTEQGKIIPRRQTGTCSKHQRELALAIKRARYMALIQYKGD